MCDTIRNNIKQLVTNNQKNKTHFFFFFFIQKVKKKLGSAPKNRDGRVTGSKAFFLGLTIDILVKLFYIIITH